jgi:hypothetical protein
MTCLVIVLATAYPIGGSWKNFIGALSNPKILSVEGSRFSTADFAISWQPSPAKLSNIKARKTKFSLRF